jgi:hypothetical protein
VLTDATIAAPAPAADASLWDAVEYVSMDRGFSSAWQERP